MRIRANCANEPVWKECNAHFKLPNELKILDEIVHNIWWSWNYEVMELFAFIDKELWNRVEGNPVLFLQSLPFSRLEAITKDSSLMESIKMLYSTFEDYMNEPYNKNIPSIAYFSMEYGLSHVLKIYSGGLGILAGDYIKEASDIRADLTAIGFLYRYGYFTQSLSIDGQQIANYEAQHFDQLPIRQVMDKNDQPLVLDVFYNSFVVYSYVWVVNVGRIKLYLLDTDLEQNSEWDRCITSRLYGGSKEDRLKQEYLLGVGGIMLLSKLGIKKQLYHCNEGHAALINAQRLVDYIQNSKLTFNQALEVIRASALYTCHTPVPAGHDYFEENLFRKYMDHFPDKLGISWQDFMDMGRTNPGSQEEFSMSVFALNTCQEANGVSKLHGTVSKRMFAPLWKGYYPQELHVGYVTNGVHMPTWAASEWRRCYEKHFGQSFYKDQSNIKTWGKIYQVEDEEIWNIRTTLKKRLVNYIKDSFKDNWLKNQGDPSKVVSILDRIDSNALLIGFGRRFATYKRAHLLFTNLDRLAKILNNPYYPVQFIFTGKAHPADGGGQDLIKRIVDISRRSEFLGKIIFLENYDMRLAKRLISGVDIWLNTPTRPLEASGTSGQKAEMNGVLNFSVLDGWWYEGYREGAGWALTDKCTYENNEFQDQLDAATIYSLLENEIIPLYYAKNSKGYSVGWIQYIKKSIAQIAPYYTTKRMFDDYIERYYNNLANRSEKLKRDNFSKAKELAAWKEEVADHWSEIEVVSINYDEGIFNQGIEVGSAISMDMVIDKHDLRADLGLEIVQLREDGVGEESITIEAGTLEKVEGSKLYFTVKLPVSHPGTIKYGVRIHPFNKDLPHRMDFAYVKWVHI
ncbi:MAG: glycosyltransferase family 1 protein [Candidatus Azobacteroides pseudotrichonymphae]|nr:MAG: glycosyltransferase family 1 protein [Candidatus Azobacteroides pseudotrichonymphae]